MILQVDHISKAFGDKQVLADVSFCADGGQAVALLGGNGAGKTTLLRIITRLLQPDSGTVLFDGHPLNQADLRQMGYLPEERGLYRNMRVCDGFCHCLPFPDNSFDIGLSSHFLLLYTALGLDFHISAITEMLRVCQEVRIFPLCDLDSNRSDIIEAVIAHFRKTYAVEIQKTDYEFQKGANRLLVIYNQSNK